MDIWKLSKHPKEENSKEKDESHTKISLREKFNQVTITFHQTSSSNNIPTATMTNNPLTNTLHSLNLSNNSPGTMYSPLSTLTDPDGFTGQELSVPLKSQRVPMLLLRTNVREKKVEEGGGGRSNGDPRLAGLEPMSFFVFVFVLRVPSSFPSLSP